MSESEICGCSATQLSGMLEKSEVSPTEILEAVLVRMDRLNPAINAIVTTDERGARAAAAASERRQIAGERLGPLDGVVVTVKDNIFTRGTRTTWGSALYADLVPELDDVAVARLRAAGATILGKTNTPELALSAVTDNRVFGPTRNPWDLTRTPGGSSGGAAAAVAAGLAPVALATDAGGSIRRPCAYTGTVGLKPSIGRVPRAHGFPATAHDLQTIGPIGRTVRDVAVMFDVIAGPDERDRATLAFVGADPSGQGAANARPLRILFVPRIAGQPIEPEIVAKVSRAADAFTHLGHTVEQGDLPVDLADVDEIWSTLTAAGSAHGVSRHADWQARVTPGIRAMAENGIAMPSIRYVKALDTLTTLRRRFGESTRMIDIILTPTSPASPWIVGEPFPKTIAGEAAGPRTAAAFATFVNVIGLPAIALPAEPSTDGMPIGFQLIGRFGAERMLLELAAIYEAAHPWSGRWPGIVHDAAAAASLAQ